MLSKPKLINYVLRYLAQFAPSAGASGCFGALGDPWGHAASQGAHNGGEWSQPGHHGTKLLANLFGLDKDSFAQQFALHQVATPKALQDIRNQ